MSMYRFNVFSTFLILDITLTVRTNILSLQVVLLCKLLPFFASNNCPFLSGSIFLKVAHTKYVSKNEAF